MNIRQLYYFRQIAKHENMTTAASELYIAQSALSIALANLEKNLGVKLFEREKGRLILNEYGKILLHYADIIIQNYDQALADIRAQKNLDSKTIRVGVIDEYFSREAILSFITTYPDINIVQSMIFPHMLQSDQLLHNNYDFIVAPLSQHHQGFAYDVIAEDELYLLVPESHPLASKGSVSLSDLNGEDLIIPGSGYSFHDFILHLLADKGIHPKNIKECIVSIIHEMVLEGSGIAIIINSMQHSDLAVDRLRKLPLDTHIKRQKALIYSSESVLSGPKRAFRDYIIGFFSKRNQSEL